MQGKNRKSVSKKSLEKKADLLYKQAILLIHKYLCEACGKPAITAHHFYPKGMARHLRYNLDNGISICGGCHIRHHKGNDPRIHENITKKRGKDWRDSLEKWKNETHQSFETKEFYLRNIADLEDIIKTTKMRNE